ncbi:hypothetical protein C7401_12916 [Paraburkholderia unamae]|uniref:hypothetical protein n=1 Tax=Paraburkholderia unamae TaxID=219649 RepID=UPI000DC4A186|nr:hypothetical protein [Paraburkholderia unamae]RAR53062.1 hypothetical protein C7401_12916 [Paraburkholderia unamae]
MNLHTALRMAFLAAASALAGVGAAHAQDNSGADRPTTAPATESSGAKANGVYPAPTHGVEQGVPAGKRGQTTQTTHSANHKPHHAKQPASDAMSATKAMKATTAHGASGAAGRGDAKGQ